MYNQYETKSRKFSSDAISKVISTIDNATISVDRELLIASLIVYTLWLSDAEITKDIPRLQAAAASVSDHICFVVGMPIHINPKLAN